MSVVDAVAIEAVLESAPSCSDRAGAEAALMSALAAARAPRRSREGDPRGWQLGVSVRVVAPGIKAADAHIHDDRGELVAKRSLRDTTTGSCVALVHAVAVWAEVVLDAELARAHDAPADEADAAQRTGNVVPWSGGGRPSGVGATQPEDRSDGGSSPSVPAAHPWELGSMLFLRNGAEATSGMYGISPFVTVAFADRGRWVARPSMAYGTSTSRTRSDGPGGESLQMVGGRLDVCRRMPGNYIDHHGIEFDACLGSDMAHVWTRTQSVLRASAGPSAVLRGELGENFGLEIRTVVGVNLARGGLGPELPPFVLVAEVGGSVRFQ